MPIRNLRTMTEAQKKEWIRSCRNARYQKRRYEPYAGNSAEKYVDLQMRDIEKRIETREGLEITDDSWL